MTRETLYKRYIIVNQYIHNQTEENWQKLVKYIKEEKQKMNKEELIKKISEKELNRLNNLSIEELQKEVSEWFNDEILEGESRADITNDYMIDFQRYREEESEEELKEKLQNYEI